MDIEAKAVVSVTEFGARGDGESNDTPAIQEAIAATAAKGGGGVWFPAGKYRTGTLRVPSYVGLFGLPTWSYHNNGGTDLVLADEKSTCLIDLTGSHGARVSGLGLNGGKLGQKIVGIYLDGSKHKQEDTLFIENCRITHFTGDGIRLDGVWGFTVRDNMIIFNDGNGLSFTQWDGWVHDNIFNNNKGWGIFARPWNGAMTVTGNRIEWNDLGGVRVDRGEKWQINNNFIDRSGGPGLQIDGGEPVDRGYGKPAAHTITGNVFNRSGAKKPLDAPDCCHVYLDNQNGVTITGNTFTTGRNDSGTGQLSPTYGIVSKDTQGCIVTNNVWPKGVIKEFLLDLGGNRDSNIATQNPGYPGDASYPPAGQG